ncbi:MULTISPECIES: CS1 type fimbrial major subunit [Pseudomonas]|uniref:CS1 type fimbrial major subunit n=1 Tax=Pseudomonas TaxID=286 RepID=UPI00067666F2|nr:MULTISPECIES: CS1 type fimbrial major subunit [Pseudomonas]KNC06888.1 adhesin [Pseudomonas sp. RIT-PI-a]KQQ57347.1 adhesin [Pseudomonas sp. Leaf129]
MKSRLLALPLALLMTGSAWADQRIDHTLTVTATIPTDKFFVEPLGGNWMNDPQNMSFKPVDGTLEPIRKQLSVKSSSGAIKAKLLNSPAMTSGANTIALNVKIGSQVLSTKSEIVTTAADAAAGSVVDFLVTAGAKPTTGYVPGNYQGLVNLVFETPDPK